MTQLVIVYGPSGSGKTRLLISLAERLSSQRRLKVFHHSVHEVTENLLDNLKRGTIECFRKSLLDYQIFLIDNMFVLQGKPFTAREIFSIFRMLIDMHRPVVIASDIEPSIMASWADDNGSMIKTSRIISMTTKNQAQ